MRSLGSLTVLVSLVFLVIRAVLGSRGKLASLVITVCLYGLSDRGLPVCLSILIVISHLIIVVRLYSPSVLPMLFSRLDFQPG